MNMNQFTTLSDIELNELERVAYAEGNTRTADLLALVAELQQEITELQEKIEDTQTLEDWEKHNGPAYEYVQFFNECFQRLNSHYPAPSVTSDYDKSIIFNAIERGEA